MNDMSNTMNDMNNDINEKRSDLKHSFDNDSNAINSVSSAVEILKVDTHEINITNVEQFNSTIHNLDANNKDNLINMTDILAIQIHKSNTLHASKIKCLF